MQNNNLKFQPIDGHPNGLKHHKSKKIIFLIAIAVAGVIIGLLSVFMIWLSIQLSPLDKASEKTVDIIIESGKSALEIANDLEEKLIIRSSTAFDIYVRYINKNNNLQAGIYSLSPSESAKDIVDRLVVGDVKKLIVTFYPGATLVDNFTQDGEKSYDITSSLRLAGFSDDKIAAALSKTYDSPLFKDKPENTDLEGYIYGETYSFSSGATVEDILETVFSHFNDIIENNNLVEKFANRGLSLYEGITLASIVQREASDSEAQKKIAQVFYSRLNIGMSLGSDVTYQYISDKLGVERSVNIDSPYNTRRYAGLPPGPIATPGLSALLAVADPADTEYLYFLAGDDKIIYFAYTDAEHDQNIVNHCQIGCSVQ